jgi:pimeloyl-ACP methyl ester carboxylesterase
VLCHHLGVLPRLTIEPFYPRLDAGEVQALMQRLGIARLPETGDGGWGMGVPKEWLSELISGWRAFEVGAFQARLDSYKHLQVRVGGLTLHLLHEAGRGPRPQPLVLTHGWPGSFCEFLELVPLLTDPANHGASSDDAFTVIVPSLPGFGFSGPPPPGGIPAADVARLWDRIMVEGLGYDRYFAHGSDLGAGITAHLARAHPGAVAAIHLASPHLAPPLVASSEPEAKFAAEIEEWAAEEGGYAHEHSTKPFTIGAALQDSPVGLAAWIGEKVRSWSSVGADGEPTFPRDLLLATLTLYWTTNTVISSLLPYWTYRHEPDGRLPIDDPPVTPTAVGVFAGERVPFPKPPRQLGERYFSISAWEEHDRGGHFPAVSEPHLLAEALRNAFRPLR